MNSSQIVHVVSNVIRAFQQSHPNNIITHDDIISFLIGKYNNPSDHPIDAPPLPNIQFFELLLLPSPTVISFPLSSQISYKLTSSEKHSITLHKNFIKKNTTTTVKKCRVVRESPIPPPVVETDNYADSELHSEPYLEPTVCFNNLTQNIPLNVDPPLVVKSRKTTKKSKSTENTLVVDPTENTPLVVKSRKTTKKSKSTENIPVVNPTENIPVVNPTENIPVVDPTENIPVVNPTENIPVVDPTENTPLVVKSRKTTKKSKSTENTPVVNPTENTPLVVKSKKTTKKSKSTENTLIVDPTENIPVVDPTVASSNNETPPPTVASPNNNNENHPPTVASSNHLLCPPSFSPTILPISFHNHTAFHKHNIIAIFSHHSSGLDFYSHPDQPNLLILATHLPHIFLHHSLSISHT